MKKNEALTNDELCRIAITGLSRSVEMLEEFVLNHVDPTVLSTNQERDFLNRVKERKNTHDNPIAVYLRPKDELPDV